MFWSLYKRMKAKTKLSQPLKSPGSYWVLAPMAGIGAFILLYLIAALLYPGGSQANSQSVGFSWMHNYWCNLLNSQAINGQPNQAQPVALLAMLILCISLAVFWYLLPNLFAFRRASRMIIQGTGISSMVMAALIFTSYHDRLINLAGLLGLVTLLYTFIGLYQQKYKGLFWLGCGCFALMGLNNYIYYTHDQLYWLPSLQKITFAFFLSWVGFLNWEIYKKQTLAAECKVS